MVLLHYVINSVWSILHFELSFILLIAAINFDHSTGFINTAVTDTLEGVIVCECETRL